MNSKITRTLSAAFLMGATVFVASGLVSSAPVYAAAAPKFTIENKALADAVKTAQDDYKAGRFAEALAKAKEADGIREGKPAALNPILHGMIIDYAIKAKDFPSALAQIEKNIAANEGNKNENLKQALSVANMMNNKAKVAEYAAQLGNSLDPDTRLYIAGTLATAGQYKEALAQADPLLQAANPPEAALKFQQAVYFKMNDAVGRRAALERLALNYPKLEYWHDLLQLARNEKGINDEQTMDIYRLRLALGDLKADSEYQEAAQQALIAGYPSEAKTVLDKGTAAKAVQNSERVTRLFKKINDDIMANVAIQTDLQKKAGSDPNASVKLGMIYWSMGKFKESEDAIRAGIAKGKLADPEGAKVALGHALFSQGKKPEAVAAFDSVARNSKEAPIARLWSIYARKG
jgi:tetratricopeptide (TPR) repeat protein